MPTLPQTEFRLSFHASFGAIDAAHGFLKDVSLMTEGEALGHGVWCDLKTLQSVYQLAAKTPIKAYLTHGSFFEPDRLGDEVGLFAGIHIEGNQLKAKQFTFFKSFKEGRKDKYEAIMELAQADASLFGVSLSFSGELVWVLADGVEKPIDEDGGDVIPMGAIREMPSVRVTRVYSADFVSDPAANPNGLFDERRIAAAKILGIELKPISSPSLLAKKEEKTPVIEAPPVDTQLSVETKPLFPMIKELRTKYTDPVKFARACELLGEDNKLTIEAIEVKLSAEAETARVKQLESDYAAQTKALAENKTKIEQFEKDLAASKKGADPLNLGKGADAAGDSGKLVEQWLKMSGGEATMFWEKHKDAINAWRALNPPKMETTRP